jgi:hypothetical protein
VIRLRDCGEVCARVQFDPDACRLKMRQTGLQQLVLVQVQPAGRLQFFKLSRSARGLGHLRVLRRQLEHPELREKADINQAARAVLDRGLGARARSVALADTLPHVEQILSQGLAVSFALQAFQSNVFKLRGEANARGRIAPEAAA